VLAAVDLLYVSVVVVVAAAAVNIDVCIAEIGVGLLCVVNVPFTKICPEW
jgi:hypothetical protein